MVLAYHTIEECIIVLLIRIDEMDFLISSRYEQSILYGRDLPYAI